MVPVDVLYQHVTIFEGGIAAKEAAIMNSPRRMHVQVNTEEKDNKLTRTSFNLNS